MAGLSTGGGRVVLGVEKGERSFALHLRRSRCSGDADFTFELTESKN